MRVQSSSKLSFPLESLIKITIARSNNIPSIHRRPVIPRPDPSIKIGDQIRFPWSSRHERIEISRRFWPGIATMILERGNEPPPGSLHSTWPRGLYVIVVSVILKRSLIRWSFAPSILAETHHDTTETTHVREPASRPVRASIVSRTESPSIPSEISSCLCRFGAERLVSAMHFTGNQWLELKATVSRWQPVLSHRLLLPPPRPGNTDPQFSLVADDRALLSTYPGQRRQSVTGWTPFPLVFSPVLRASILWDHIVDGNYPKYISKCSIPRGQWKRLSFIGSTRFRDDTRTRHYCALWLVYSFDPLPACIPPRSDRPFQRTDRVIFLILYTWFLIIHANSPDLLCFLSGKIIFS